MLTLPFPCTSTPLSDDGFQAAVDALGIDAITLWTMMDIETGGTGYLADRRPQILFERHLFSRATGGQYDSTHPNVSNPVAGGYGLAGANQYVRMAEALALDQEAALASASWGLGQVLGSNFAPTFASTDDMVAAMCATEDAQLQTIVNYVLSRKLQSALQNQNWVAYALGYNGKTYAKNHYDTRLAAQHTMYMSGMALPDLDVRAAQLYLLFLGYNPHGIDGQAGPGTLGALNSFQAAQGIAPTATLDATVASTLAAALPAAINLTMP